MIGKGILFASDETVLIPEIIHYEIDNFGESYINTTQKIIQYSEELDKDGEVFIKCASLILSNFGMTRSGPFKKREEGNILLDCWSKVGSSIIEIKIQYCKVAVQEIDSY